MTKQLCNYEAALIALTDLIAVFAFAHRTVMAALGIVIGAAVGLEVCIEVCLASE